MWSHKLKPGVANLPFYVKRRARICISSKEGCSGNYVVWVRVCELCKNLSCAFLGKSVISVLFGNSLRGQHREPHNSTAGQIRPCMHTQDVTYERHLTHRERDRHWTQSPHMDTGHQKPTWLQLQERCGWTSPIKLSHPDTFLRASVESVSTQFAAKQRCSCGRCLRWRSELTLRNNYGHDARVPPPESGSGRDPLHKEPEWPTQYSTCM